MTGETVGKAIGASAHKSGSRVRDPRTKRITAFDYADFPLYCYAMGAYLYAIFFQTGVWELPGQLTLICLITVFIVFHYMLARNYLVMRAIDDHSENPHAGFAFVASNTGFFGQLERLLRLAIILVAILTPKEGYLKLFSDAVICVSLLMQSALRWLPEIILSSVSKAPSNDVLHHSIPYYGAVIFVFFVLFLAWDLTNIASAWLGIRGSRIKISLSDDNLRLGDRSYRSLLCYMNICKPDKHGGADEAVAFLNSDRVRDPARKPRIAEGHIWRLYFSSPKAKERASGMIVGWTMVLAGQSEFGTIPQALLIVSIIAYFICVSKNERPLSKFGEFLYLLVAYFRDTGPTPIKPPNRPSAL